MSEPRFQIAGETCQADEQRHGEQTTRCAELKWIGVVIMVVLLAAAILLMERRSRPTFQTGADGRRAERERP